MQHLFDYMLHWEDDWEICDPDDHIKNLLEVMWSKPYIKSVIMTPFQHGRWSIMPAVECKTSKGKRYFLIPDYGDIIVSWPGFSLNPGLHDVCAVHAVGEYPIVKLHEWTFSESYREKGFKVAHFPDYLVNHFCMDTAYSSDDDR